MATPKTWTADDVQLGKLTIMRDGSIIGVDRRYEFVDAQNDWIPAIKGRRLRVDVPWSEIPTNVQTALQTIDTWTYNQILLQEGMQD